MYLLTGLNRPRQSWEICLDWNQIKQICHTGFPAELVLEFTCINPKSHLDDGKRPQIPSGKGLYLSLPGNMLCSCSALPLAQISINFCPSQWMRINISRPSYIKALLFLQLAFLLVCWPLRRGVTTGTLLPRCSHPFCPCWWMVTKGWLVSSSVSWWAQLMEVVLVVVLENFGLGATTPTHLRPLLDTPGAKEKHEHVHALPNGNMWMC